MTFEHTLTDLDIENEYPKLVRDGIPAIIKANEGYDVPTRELTDRGERRKFLGKKGIEEATELSEAGTDEHRLEELADYEELVDTWLEEMGKTREDLRAVQDEKRQKRGGFKKWLLMLANAPDKGQVDV
jgi:predicted house-cleaning noncanonical NTP pyrophosphatase (MazG superfamily)